MKPNDKVESTCFSKIANVKNYRSLIFFIYFLNNNVNTIFLKQIPYSQWDIFIIFQKVENRLTPFNSGSVEFYVIVISRLLFMWYQSTIISKISAY